MYFLKIDMTIQWDKQDDWLPQRYREVLYSYEISQNVAYATHIKGHTLEKLFKITNQIMRRKNENPLP